jgi:hypothetical protein
MQRTDFVLTPEYYNFLMIFVCTLTVLWSLRVLKRIYRMFSVRNAYLNQRIIQIQGLSSYLSYFENPTQTHANSIIHTRQSKPPISMEAVNVPFLLEEAVLSEDSVGKFRIDLKLLASVETNVILLFNFDVQKFKNLLSSEGGKNNFEFNNNQKTKLTVII